MVVVDQARKALGRTIEVSVTSVLQTTAGKMIFCRWPDAGVVEEAASRSNNRIGDRRDLRPVRDLRAPERRENERRDGVMPIPPGVPVPVPSSHAPAPMDVAASDLPAEPPAAKAE
jgi:hypothetical protein